MKSGQGQITFFDHNRGWGFIENSEGRVFFHVRNSAGFHVELGMVVSFDYAPSYKLGQKEQAINLRAAADALVQAALKASDAGEQS